jgi:hypothetical protein
MEKPKTFGEYAKAARQERERYSDDLITQK